MFESGRSRQALPVADGELYYWPAFLDAGQSSDYLQRLTTELDWRQETTVIAGRRLLTPRLVSWHGDAGAVYQYSGLTHQPQAWTASLSALKQAVEQASGQRFNSVLGNLYRDGQDSMGWHADQEKTLGKNPVIASLSLGAERLFKLRHNQTGETLNLSLASGSLLVMGGAMQHHWRHCLPKTKQAVATRINLTFRRIILPQPNP